MSKIIFGFLLLFSTANCFFFSRMTSPNSESVWIGEVSESLAAGDTNFNKGYTCALFGYRFGIPLGILAYRLKIINPFNIDVTDVSYKYNRVFVKCSNGRDRSFISQGFLFYKVIGAQNSAESIEISEQSTKLKLHKFDKDTFVTLQSFDGKKKHTFKVEKYNGMIKVNPEDFNFKLLVEIAKVGKLSRKKTHVFLRDSWRNLMLKELSRIDYETFPTLISSDDYEVIEPLKKIIFQSAKIGDLKTLDVLLKRFEAFDKLDKIIDARTENDITPLHKAAEFGQVQVIELLLSRNASIEAKNGVKLTALHFAVWKEQTAVVELLLSRNANIDARDLGFIAPIHLAAMFGHVNLVELLLTRSANIESKTKTYWTPLHFAAWKGQVKVVELLLSRLADIEAKDVQKFTPLHTATRFGQVKVVEQLLNREANVEAKAENNLTPLHLAAWKGEVKVVELLLRRNANIEAKTENNLTPLYYAAYYEQAAVVELLLSKNADIEAKEDNGETAGYYIKRMNKK